MVLSPHVTAVNTYPLKGARRFPNNELWVHEKTGVVDDRRYAIVLPQHTSSSEWRRKSHYAVGLNTPKMAAETPVYDTDSKASSRELSQQYLQELRVRLGINNDVTIDDTKGRYSITDKNEPFVSFLNLATLRAFASHVGSPHLASQRFRMNVEFDGFEPGAEYGWLGKLISVGPCLFEVVELCVRCNAINANPETGKADTKLIKPLREFMSILHGGKHKGVVMGFYAHPITSGVIKPRDPVEVLL